MKWKKLGGILNWFTIIKHNFKKNWAKIYMESNGFDKILCIKIKIKSVIMNIIIGYLTPNKDLLE